MTKILGGPYGHGFMPWYSEDDPFDANFHVRVPDTIRHYDTNNRFLAEYHINEHGFRAADGIDSPLWFLGCSHVFGEALPVEETFAHIFAQVQAQEYHNFGTPGASTELLARLLFKLRSRLATHTTVVLLPLPARYETIVDGRFTNIVPNHSNYLDLLPSQQLEGHMRYRSMSAVMLIKSLCEHHDCHFFTYSDPGSAWHQHEDLGFREQLSATAIPVDLIVDRAADGRHYGKQTHENIAKYMLDHVHQVQAHDVHRSITIAR